MSIELILYCEGEIVKIQIRIGESIQYTGNTAVTSWQEGRTKIEEGQPVDRPLPRTRN
jgi:hypothetical protein